MARPPTKRQPTRRQEDHYEELGLPTEDKVFSLYSLGEGNRDEA